MLRHKIYKKNNSKYCLYRASFTDKLSRSIKNPLSFILRFLWRW